MKPKVIFIDDEISILKSIRRGFRKETFEVLTTDSPDEVFSLCSKDQIAVVVSDQRMPKMEGVDVLDQVKKLSPNTVRIMLTGYADIHAAVKAINKSNVFRFVAKPWKDDELKEIIQQGIDQFSLIQENKRLNILTMEQNKELKDLNDNLEDKVKKRTEEVTNLNKKLQFSFLGSIQLMDKIAQIHNTSVGAHSKRVAQLVMALSKKMEIPKKELFEIEVAALLHDIGKLGIPSQVLEKEISKMNPDEKSLLKKHTLVGEKLINEIPNLENAAKIIRHHHEYFNGKGHPDRLSGEAIPLGSRMIAVIDAFDKIIHSGNQFGNENTEMALEFLSENENILFDPKIVGLLKEHLEMTNENEMEVGLKELLPGMQLSRTVKNSEGRNIGEKETVLTDKTINILTTWLEKDPLIDGVFVYRYVQKQKKPEKAKVAVNWE